MQFLLPVSSETVTRLCLFMRKRDLFVAPIKIKLLSIVLVLVFFLPIIRFDYTTRGTNEMTSEWNYKHQKSCYRGKFQGNFDEGKGNLVRLFRVRVNRVKMTEKRGEIQGKLDLVRV